LANHNGSSIEEAITLMNDPLGMLVKQKGNKNIRQQFPQLMLDWGKHVESWINKLPFPVLVVRYEDMLEKPVETFSNAARFIGLTFTEKELILALNKCSFSNLKEKEQQAGFIEKMRGVKTFFRAGKQDSWKAELTTGQIELITMNFQSVSNLFNYL
jgi:hypothetical protein